MTTSPNQSVCRLSPTNPFLLRSFRVSLWCAIFQFLRSKTRGPSLTPLAYSVASSWVNRVSLLLKLLQHQLLLSPMWPLVQAFLACRVSFPQPPGRSGFCCHSSTVPSQPSSQMVFPKCKSGDVTSVLKALW